MTRQSSAHQIVVGTTLNTSIKPGSRKGRRNYDVAFKKQLAIAACAPGISVARLALEHGINANMLHKWRREYLAVADSGGNELRPTEFLAVSVGPSRQPAALVAKPPVSSSGTIEIRMGAALLRLEGAVDAATLAQVLRYLQP